MISLDNDNGLSVNQALGKYPNVAQITQVAQVEIQIRPFVLCILAR